MRDLKITILPGERGGFTVLNLEDYKFTVCALLRDASRSDEQERYNYKEERRQ